MTNPTYQDAVTEYNSILKGLYAPEPGAPKKRGAKRGAAGVEPDVLAQRADEFAAASVNVADMTGVYLNDANPQIRQAAEYRMLLQANAEMEVAYTLFQAAEVEIYGPQEGVKRSVRGPSTAQAALANALESPLEAGLEPFIEMSKKRGTRSKDPVKARKDLLDQAAFTLDTVASLASTTSSQALDALFKLDPDLLKRAIAPINKEISEAVEKAAEKINEKIKALLRAAVRLLLQVYDRILALIGKDAEETARKKVKDWVDELRTDHKKKGDEPKLAEKLVKQVYIVDAINGEVTGWMKDTKAGLDEINKATDAIEALAAGFEKKAEQIQSFLKLLASVPKVTTGIAAAVAQFQPQWVPAIAAAVPVVEALRGAVTLGLLGYTLFTGYDHVDSGKATFFNRFTVEIPDRVEGVRETVMKAVVVS
jgi:hypothetical protein